MDAGGIARVHVETWRTAYAGLLPDDYLVQMSEPRRQAWWRESIGRRKAGIVRVATAADGTVVGFGNAGRTRTPSLPYAGEIYTLYVLPDWQERGIGRRLVRSLFEELAAARLRSVMLWVLAGNPSRFFYEGMAGKAVGTRMESFAGTRLAETAYGWDDLPGWLARRR